MTKHIVTYEIEKRPLCLKGKNVKESNAVWGNMYRQEARLHKILGLSLMFYSKSSVL